MKAPASPAPCPLTCGHEEGDAELAAEHPRAQVLQGAPVEGQGPAHQHVQHHAEALRPKQTHVSNAKRSENPSLGNSCFWHLPVGKIQDAVARTPFWKRFFGKHFLLCQDFSPRHVLSTQEAKPNKQSKNQIKVREKEAHHIPKYQPLAHRTPCLQRALEQHREDSHTRF